MSTAQERAAQRQLLTVEELQGAIRAVQSAIGDACLALAPGGGTLKRVLADGTAPEEVGSLASCRRCLAAVCRRSLSRQRFHRVCSAL